MNDFFSLQLHKSQATKAKAEGKTVVAASVRAIRTRKLFDSKMWIYREDEEDGALMNQNLMT